ncbi:MAG: hypothetical protein HY868_07090 [Chloroflexi bacterium]|nr:hypothetical protein [Chloroflexota bacterium]
MSDDPRNLAWAKPVHHLHPENVPPGVTTVNVDGRHVSGALQGFGQMWQATYRVRLSGVQVTPAQVIADWKINFAKFQPPGNRVYPPLDGVKPGEMVYFDLNMFQAPAMKQLTPMKSGVMILYADDEQFTVMTPEGFPISGWNTFSASVEEDVTVAQVQGLYRATDPIYEMGMRFFGGAHEQESTWMHVLTQLATRWGVNGQVNMTKTCVDPKMQWQYVKNTWQNAMFRTLLYNVGAPVRWVSGRGKS